MTNDIDIIKMELINEVIALYNNRLHYGAFVRCKSGVIRLYNKDTNVRVLTLQNVSELFGKHTSTWDYFVLQDLHSEIQS